MNKEWLLKYFPILATVLFQLSTIGHIARMIKEKSSLGQEPLSWVFVLVGLFMWVAWYKTFTPEHKIPFWSTVTQIIMGLIGLGVCVYFRFF